MKIIESLGEHKYIVKIEPPPDRADGKYRWSEFQMVHDYVHFGSKIHIQHESCLVNKSVTTYIGLHIPIRDFAQVVLPRVVQHEYVQAKHFAIRKSEDGDYHPYCYNNQVVQYWENGSAMVAVLMTGDHNYSHMTLKFFNEYVRKQIDYK
jgi:hypothetical protein